MAGSTTLGVAITYGTWQCLGGFSTTTWPCRVSSPQRLNGKGWSARWPSREGLFAQWLPAQVLTGDDSCAVHSHVV